MSTLSYGTPAGTWLERLPLGDGTIGAMLDGGVAVSRIDLNHEGAWSGSPGSEAEGVSITPDAAREAVASARALLADGRPDLAATALTPLQARYCQSYLPLGTLVLRRSTTGPAGYRRGLDLATAVHTVETAELRERAMVSAPFGVLVVESSAPLTADLETPHRELARDDTDTTRELLVRLPSDVPPHHEGDRFPAATWSDAPGAAVEAVVAVRLVPRPDGGTTALLAAATTYDGPGRALRPLEDARAEVRRRLDAAESAGADAVFAEGSRAHSAIFERCALTLGASSGSPAAHTDERLEAVFAADGHPLADDPGAAGLLFDVGRYLAISSARPGSALPPTLQGLWNNSMRPPWSSNFTININAQMNHWSSHATNMSETAEPWLDYVEAMSTAGAATARLLYDTPGWTAHHNADAWLFSSPVGAGDGDARWAHWPMAGPWLVRSVWDAQEFTGSVDLARRLWPIARGAAEFCLAWQHRDASGAWVTSPATSPENTYLMADGTEVALDTGSAMDDQLLVDLYGIVGRLASALEIDDEVADACADRLASMDRTPAITSSGIVREWAVDRHEVDPQHRHVSPLYGLYPGAGLWDAEARTAAERTLERRGDESTGWSLVWKIALWARLGRGDKVGDLLALLFRDATADRGGEAGGLYPNMFAAHPPFQIDANLGFPGVLAEALLQSHDGIELLPALPPQLPTGSARGLVARPGVEVDLEWNDGALVRAVLRPRETTSVELRYRGDRLLLDLAEETVVTPDDFAGAGAGQSSVPAKR